jgi:hypothetical protein
MLKENNYNKFLPFDHFNIDNDFEFIKHINSKNLDNVLFFMNSNNNSPHSSINDFVNDLEFK